MADQFLYFTELLGMPVFDLKGRRIGRVETRPWCHWSIRGALTGCWWAVRRVTDHPLRSGEQNRARQGDFPERRAAGSLPRRRVHAAHRAGLAGPADYRRERTQGGARQRRDHGNPPRPRARHVSVLEVDIGIRSIFRRLFQGVLPPRWIRRLQTRIPPNSIPWDFATWWSRTRYGGCA